MVELIPATSVSVIGLSASRVTPTDCTSVGSFNQQLHGYQTYHPVPTASAASSSASISAASAGAESTPRHHPPPLYSSSPSTGGGPGLHHSGSRASQVGRSTSSGNVAHGRHDPPIVHRDASGILYDGRGRPVVGGAKINGAESYSLPYNLASLAINPNNDSSSNNALFIAAAAAAAVAGGGGGGGDPLLASPYDLSTADPAAIEHLIQSPSSASNNGVYVQNLISSPYHNSDIISGGGGGGGGGRITAQPVPRSNNGASGNRPQHHPSSTQGRHVGQLRSMPAAASSASMSSSSRDGAVFASAYAQQIPSASFAASSRTGSLPPPQNNPAAVAVSSSLKSVMSPSSSSSSHHHRNPGAAIHNSAVSQVGNG